MKTKTISLLLVMAVCLLLFAGCQDAKLHSYTEDLLAEQGDEVIEETPAVEESQTPKDYSSAYNYFPIEQVILTVDGVDITWGELFYWYIYDVSNLESYFGEITDWDADCAFYPTKTYREYVTDNAIDSLKHYCALERKAADIGVELSDIDKTMIKAKWDENVLNYGDGDEQAFIDYMAQGYLSKTTYDHINYVNALYSKMLQELFGEKGEKISDADLYEVAADLGYVRVKHILISTVDETGAELSEEQLAEKEKRANEIQAELASISDPAAREARLDQLISSEGEDPGVAYYTDGYTFTSGAMAQEFEEAAFALEENEISQVVKTGYGYHILMRLPLDRNAAVEYQSETEYTTLGSYVAQEMFVAESESWAKQAAVETTEAYDNLDLAAVFAAPVSSAAPSEEPAEEPKE